ncbi:hypothetical protein ABIE00_005122 [Arthrobacter sp. OAP107]
MGWRRKPTGDLIPRLGSPRQVENGNLYSAGVAKRLRMGIPGSSSSAAARSSAPADSDSSVIGTQFRPLLDSAQEGHGDVLLRWDGADRNRVGCRLLPLPARILLWKGRTPTRLKGPLPGRLPGDSSARCCAPGRPPRRAAYSRSLVLQYSGIGCGNVDHTKQTVAHAPPPRPGVPDEVGERNDLSALPCMRHTRQPWTPRRWRSQRHRESSLWFCEFGRR